MKKLYSLLAAATLILSGNSALANTLAAVTEASVANPSGRLITFDSSAPGEILNDVAISGLNPTETIVGIDVRPSTGILYAVSNLSRVLILNPNTGVATLVTTLSTPLDGTATDFGVDFYPDTVSDRLRIVSNTGQNLRFNPNDNTTFADTPLAYVAGDANVGKTTGIVDLAYDRNDTNAGTATTLFAIESNLYGTKTLPDNSTVPAQVLVRIGDVNGTPNLPNTGELHTVASIGLDGILFRGFDVSPDLDFGVQQIFAGVLLPNGANPKIAALEQIDLATGAEVTLGYIGDGTPQIVDIAVIPSVQFSASLYSSNEGSNVVITVARSGGISNTATVNYATYNDTASGADYTVSSGMLTFTTNDSSEFISIPITDDAIPEWDETFDVVLFDVAGPANPALGRNSTATVRINANDFTDKAGPKVLHFALTGSSRAINGAVIQFDESLDSITATNISPASASNYVLTLMGKKKTVLTPNFASYDPRERTVTLGFNTPFSLLDVKRFAFTINGKNIPAKGATPAKFGVTDLNGNLLDGDSNGVPGGNAILMSTVFTGKTVGKTALTIKEPDGDRATITLGDAGGLNPTGSLGSLEGHIPAGKKRPFEPQIWIVNPIPLESKITGTVKPGPKGDGIVTISETIGIDMIQFTPLLNNPSFRMDTLTFGGEATGF